MNYRDFLRRNIFSVRNAGRTLPEKNLQLGYDKAPVGLDLFHNDIGGCADDTR